MNPLQAIWGLGIAALVVSLIEHFRGSELATTDVKLKLRALWRGWPMGAYARYAFHEAPQPSRGRLRRSGWANVVFLSSWAIGIATMGGQLWFLALGGVIGAGLLTSSLLRAPGRG